MNSPMKRTVSVRGHKTSITLEDGFWNSLREIAKHGGMPLGRLIAVVNEMPERGNLSSTLRLFVLAFYKERATRASEVTPWETPV